MDRSVHPLTPRAARVSSTAARPPPRSTSPTTPQGFRIDGAADGDRAGYSVATGDVNGDGRRDFVLGAIGTACRSGALPLTCDGDAGAAYVVFGAGRPGQRRPREPRRRRLPDERRVDATPAPAGRSPPTTSPATARPTSRSPRSAPRTHVSAPPTSSRARRPPAPWRWAPLGADGFRIDGEEGDQSGWALASGDVDGDRKAELVIGVPFHNPAGGAHGRLGVCPQGRRDQRQRLARLAAARATTASTAPRPRTARAGRCATQPRPQRGRPRRGPARRPGRGPRPGRRWPRRSRSVRRTWSTAPRPRPTSNVGH